MNQDVDALFTLVVGLLLIHWGNQLVAQANRRLFR